MRRAGRRLLREDSPKADRRPLWFHRPDGGLLLFAGLYEAWFPEKDKAVTTFTIITTQANDLMAPIHDRMPVILPDAAVDNWLFDRALPPDALKTLLVPPPDEWPIATPTSKRVNAVKVDEPSVLTE